MPMKNKCECKQPRFCPNQLRNVVWGDIHACQANGYNNDTNENKIASFNQLKKCIHKGDPAVDDHGFQKYRTSTGCCGSATPSSKTALFYCNLFKTNDAEEHCEMRCMRREYV